MAEPMAIYGAILEFSGKQPDWVADLLRRIVSTGAPATAADLEDAVAMCKAAHGLVDPADGPTPAPLAKAHLPAVATGSSADVTLTQLHDLEHVNALLPGQTLAFAPSGLTAIYGTNGAGKSGYARVLKRLCRARGTVAPILPDVFAKAPGTPSASIAYDVGGAPSTWTGTLDANGPQPPDALSQVAVYDRAAGIHTIHNDQAVTLLPPGLDLLPMLKDVLDHVATELKNDPDNLQGNNLPELHPGTAASTFLAQLSKDTPTTQLDDACAWTPDDETKRIAAAAAVATLQANDPKTLAKKATKRATNLNTLITALQKAAADLRDDVVARVEQRLSELAAAQAAVDKNAGHDLPADALPGTGETAWKLMWKVARDFSTQHAYPFHSFPHTGDDARCVLCQQPLDDDARARLATFEAYVAGALSKALKDAQAAVGEALKHLNQAIAPGLIDGTLLVVLDELDEVDAATIQPFIAAAVTRRDALLTRLDSELPDVAIPALPEAPTVELTAAKAAAEVAAATHAASDATQAMVDAKKAMHDLEDRKALHQARAKILEPEIARLQRVAMLAKARKECTTTKLSRLASDLTAAHVTDALVTAFNTELEALGGKRLKVELYKSTTRKGTTFTGLLLKDAEHNKAVVPAVFSEGEQRAVALAWFFAELSLAVDTSAIVFDDPVTSLDHVWRRKVAARLVDESTKRQVIVFTHDAVFLHMLHSLAKAYSGPLGAVHIQRRGPRPGYCSDDVPWEKQKINKRVGTLKSDHVILTKTYNEGTSEAYVEAVTRYLDRLRKTWERAVEECLFNGAIERFGLGVQTQRVAQVDVMSTDYDAIDAGMSACSAWVHDPAQPLADPPPTPTEIAGMVNDLVAWVQVLRSRRTKHNLPNLKPIPVPAS